MSEVGYTVVLIAEAIVTNDCKTESYNKSYHLNGYGGDCHLDGFPILLGARHLS